MKGKKEIIEQLNLLLVDELTAVNQYMIHAELCKNWGYNRLHEITKKRAVAEMKHAEKLIERIIFLEGMPEVGLLNEIVIGKTIEEQLVNDFSAEEEAVKTYNQAINLAIRSSDDGTAELFRSILHDEEEHLDWLEIQLQQIRQLEINNYLVEQMD